MAKPIEATPVLNEKEYVGLLETLGLQEKRPSKDMYYIGIAIEVSRRSTCLRRRFGALLVKDDIIISTGYNGSPRGCVNCLELGICPREKANIPRGEKYELCRAVHGEANCIINSARERMLDSTMYIAGFNTDDSIVKNGKPCKMCTRLIINAGIKEVKQLDDINNEITIQTYKVSDFIKNEELDLTKSNGY